MTVSVPATMSAVVTNGFGGPEVLRVVKRPVPAPGDGEVLVRVFAAGVNRADVMQRQGVYDPPDGSPILGLEVSGEVCATGPGVSSPAVGSRVVALVSSGGYAEYVAVPIGQVAPLPDGIDPLDAAGVMEVAATVWANVFMVAGLRPGEAILVHGGASGIGTMAVQLARATGAHVATTVGNDAKSELVRQLGAEIVINYRASDFVEVLRRHGFAPDVVLDVVGGRYLRPNVDVLAVGGRLVVIGLQGGSIGEMPIGDLLYKQASVHATSLRARTVAEKSEIVAATRAGVWPLMADGIVRPVIRGRWRLSEVAAAHGAMEDPAHFGKELLVVAVPQQPPPSGGGPSGCARLGTGPRTPT